MTITGRSLRQFFNVSSRRSLDWGRFLLVGCGVYVLIYVLWLLFPWGDPEQRLLISDLASLPPIAIAAVLAWRAGTHRAASRRTRWAWQLLALAYLCLAAGDALWFYYEIVLQIEPFPSWADAGYLLFYPLVLIATLLLGVINASRTERIKFWLDGLTVFLGGGMLLWYFLLHPIAVAEHSSQVETMLSLAYPLGDLVLLFGISALVLRTPTGNRRALQLLVGGLAFFFCGDLVYVYLGLQDMYQSGHWPDALWAVSYFLAATSGYSQYRRTATETVSRQPTAWWRRPFNFLPYVAVVAGYSPLLFVARDVWTDRLGGLIIGAIALTGVVMTRQIISDQAERRSEARFRSLVQHASDIITLINRDSVILYESPAVERILGYTPEARLGTNGLDYIHPDNIPAIQELLREVMKTPGGFWSVELRARHADGSWRWIQMGLTNLLQDHTVGGIVTNYRDISERKVLEQQLIHQAFHDPLTGLANRALLTQQVEAALRRQQRYNQTTAVLFLDLDGFKTINDSLGHAMGDRLLVAVAERLLMCARKSDTVARLGGDEFAILAENIREAADATRIAERIIEALAKPIRIDGQDLLVGSSVGIAISSAPTALADEVLRNADTAMYIAKNRGKGRFEVFNPNTHDTALASLELEGDLRHAIERHEFVVHYQPVVSLSTGAVHGMEATVHWQHPRRGLIAPETFIAAAEETGLIVAIGQWALAEACRQVRTWQQQAINQAPLFISINLCADQLQSPDLLPDISRVLGETGLDPHLLHLGITERMAIELADDTINTLQHLKDLGVRITLDNFGTGYSSLAYLKRLPIDSLTIDRSLISRIEQNPEDAAIVRAITTVTEALGLMVIAEGIETADQAALVETLGCDLGQGSYFAKSLRSDEARSLVAAGFSQPMIGAGGEPVS